MSVLVIFLVALLLIADAFIFFVIGVSYSSKNFILKLKEKGWTIEPPEV